MLSFRFHNTSSISECLKYFKISEMRCYGKTKVACQEGLGRIFFSRSFTESKQCTILIGKYGKKELFYFY